MKKHILILLLSGWLVGAVTAANNAAVPEVQDNLWGAIAYADSILALSAADREAGVALQIVPTRESVVVEEGIYADLPIFDTRLLYVVPRRNGMPIRTLHAIKGVDNLPYAAEKIARYRSLAREDEVAFLLASLADPELLPFREAGLRRLRELKYFQRDLSQEEIKYLKNIFDAKNTSIGIKRFLLEHLSVNNFFAIREWMIASCLQPDLPVAAEILSQKDPEQFRRIMLQHIADDLQWPLAMAHAEKMLYDEEFQRLALLRYHYEEPQKNDDNFIPLLFVASIQIDQNRQAIRSLLIDSVDTTAYLRFCRLSEWLNLTAATAYTEEIKQFLRNNQKNTLVTDSIILPRMLAALCRVSDPEGIKFARRYLQQVPQKYSGDLAWQKKICAVFSGENQSLISYQDLLRQLQDKATASSTSASH